MIGSSPISSLPIGASSPAVSNSADVTVPTFIGALGASSTTAALTVSWSGVVSSDNVAVDHHEYRINGGAWTPASAGEEATRSHVFNGLSEGTGYIVEVRCVDLSGNASVPLAIEASTDEATGTNNISVTLTDRDGVARQNLGDLHWALFAQALPSLFAAPVAKGIFPAAAGLAQLNISLSAAVAPVGSYILVLASADGTNSVAAPVVVS